MNASARVTMKDAANCDKQCELQNSVNHQISERTLRYRVFLIACLVSASSKPIMPSRVQNVLSWSVRVCAPVRCPWGNHWRMKCVCATHKVASTTFSIILCMIFFCCGGTWMPFLSIYLLNHIINLGLWLRFFYFDMSQARLPAEFKHISKRRKRNQMGFP